MNTGNEDSMLRKYLLPFAIYGALIFGFIASLGYTGAALTVTIKWVKLWLLHYMDIMEV